MPNAVLDPRELAFLIAARHAVLATIRPDGRPRPVPICFVVDAADHANVRLISPLDDKPKAADDKHALARVRDIRDRAAVSLIIEHWDEDWSRLAWVRLDGRARLLEAVDVPPDAVERLRAKYSQYTTHSLESSPMIAVEVERATSWGALEAG